MCVCYCAGGYRDFGGIGTRQAAAALKVAVLIPGLQHANIYVKAEDTCVLSCTAVMLSGLIHASHYIVN